MRLLKSMAMTLAIISALSGCKELESSTQDEGSKEQESTMERAVSKHPTPQTDNFLTREAVVKWMNRMDTPGKTFYVYLLADTGQTLGYYVSQTRPISACTFLTPPDRLTHGDRGQYDGDFVVQSPALDGVYYGGGCDSYFFFEAETDAFIEIQGVDYFVADQPLNMDADPIRVSE